MAGFCLYIVDNRALCWCPDVAQSVSAIILRHFLVWIIVDDYCRLTLIPRREEGCQEANAMPGFRLRAYFESIRCASNSNYKSPMQLLAR